MNQIQPDLTSFCAEIAIVKSEIPSAEAQAEDVANHKTPASSGGFVCQGSEGVIMEEMIPWTKWLVLVLGLWIVVSPFVAEKLPLNLTWSNILSGAIISTVLLWDLFQMKS